MSRRRFTNAEAAEMAKAYKAGETSTKMAMRLGTNVGVILGTLRWAGITIRHAGFARFSESFKARVIAAYASGRPSAEVAQEFGVSIPAVILWTRVAGIPSHGHRKGNTERVERNAVIVAAYERGAEIPDLCKSYHLTRDRIWVLLRASGIRLRPRQRKIPNQFAAVAGLYSEGKTYTEIGARLGFSKQRAAQILSQGIRRLATQIGRASAMTTQNAPRAGPVARTVPRDDRRRGPELGGGR